MARIPSATRAGLGQQTSTVGTTPFLRRNTDQSMFGGTQAVDLQKAGAGLDTLGKELEEIEKRQGEAQDLKHKLDIENAVRQYRKDMFEGENGLLRKRLGDALGSADEQQRSWEDFRSKLKEGRTFYDPNSESRIDAFIEQKGMELDTVAWKHETVQRDEQLKGMLGRRIKDNIEDGAVNYADPRAYMQNKEAIKSSNKEIGKRFGWSQEEIDAKNKDDVSALHDQAIRAALGSKNIDMAAALYKDADEAGELDGKHKVALQEILENETVIKKSQDLADEALRKFPDDPTAAIKWIRDNSEGEAEDKGVTQAKARFDESDATARRQDAEEARRDRKESRNATEAGQEAADDVVSQKGMTEDKALAEVAKTTTGKARQQAEASVRSHFAAKKRADDTRQKELRKSAQAKFLGGKPLTPEENLAIDSVLGMRSRLEKQRQQAVRGLPFESDESVRQELMKMYRDDKVKFQQLDLYGPKYGGKLNEKHLSYFEGLQLGIDKAAAAASDRAGKEAAREERLSKAMTLAKPFLRSAGYKVGGKDDDTAAFQLRLADQLELIEDDPKLTPTERDQRLQNIALGLLLQGEEVEDGGIDDNMRVVEWNGTDGPFSLEGFEDENKDTLNTLSKRSGVPRENIAVIIQAMINRGMATTVKNIKSVYEAATGGGE